MLKFGIIIYNFKEVTYVKNSKYTDKNKNVYLLFCINTVIFINNKHSKIEYKVYYIAGIVYVIGLLFVFLAQNKKRLFSCGHNFISFSQD